MSRVLPGSIATAVCAVIDTASATARISHAGHVPAILADGDDARFLVAEGDPLLGVDAGHPPRAAASPSNRARPWCSTRTA